MGKNTSAICLLGLLIMTGTQAQLVPKQVPKVIPVPVPKGIVAPPWRALEPSDPPPQNFVDPQMPLYFHLGPGWTLARKDREVSTFHLDARSAPETAQLKAVAMLAFNPYPRSTFSGAFFYLSVIPGVTEAECEVQTKLKPERSLNALPVGGLKFSRGLDEHGKICTESRDVTYTATRHRRCVRFDLTVNTFCGGDVSGVKDMTDLELASVFKRLEGILDTVKFEGR